MNRKQNNLYDIIQISLFTFVIFSCRTLSTCISTFPHYHFWSFSKPALSLFIISKRKLLKNTLITISFYHTQNYLSKWDQISVWINFAHLCSLSNYHGTLFRIYKMLHFLPNWRLVDSQRLIRIRTKWAVSAKFHLYMNISGFKRFTWKNLDFLQMVSSKS